MTTTPISGVHPLADLFPMMSKQELQALADDIKANGLREPISITADGLIVDGRNRNAACELAKVKPHYVQVNGDAGNLILSANIFRRHMTKGQIAILAVCAELGLTLPEDDSVPKTEVDRRPQDGKKYDYQRQAHKRVEKLVSLSVIDTASRIVRWAPDHARAILDTGEGWTEARHVAEVRSNEAHSEQNRIRIMQEDSPELLVQVREDKLKLAEAWRIRESRIREERDKRSRLTGYLVDRVTPLLGKTDPKELVELYDPKLASREIGVAELDEAIAYLNSIRSEMKRQKKG